MNFSEELTFLPPMRTKRSDCAAVKVGGLIYVVGGGFGKSHLEVFNPETRQWTTTTIRTKRSGCATVEMEGQIYVIGGKSGFNQLSYAELYDPTTSQQTSIPSMNCERNCCAAVQTGGLIYVIGGHDGSKCLSSVEMFDPTSGKWTFLPSMRIKRFGCCAVEMGGLIYVIGGFDGEKVLSSVQVFNTTSRKWTSCRSMNTKRVGCAAVAKDGQIYVLGGKDEIGEVSSVEMFNPKARKWTFLPPMGTKRFGCSAVEMGGLIHVIGGYDGRNKLSSAEVIRVQTQIPESNTGLPPSLTSESPPQEQLPRNPTAAQMTRSNYGQRPPSELPQTLQLFQSKLPNVDFIPVAAEVVQVEESNTSQQLESMTLTQNLSDATTEEICQWLSKHGITKTSIDTLRREEIDGILLFEASGDEVKSVLKEEGIKAGQVARIRNAIEGAKKNGRLV